LNDYWFPQQHNMAKPSRIANRRATEKLMASSSHSKKRSEHHNKGTKLVQAFVKLPDVRYVIPLGPEYPANSLDLLVSAPTKGEESLREPADNSLNAVVLANEGVEKVHDAEINHECLSIGKGKVLVMKTQNVGSEHRYLCMYLKNTSQFAELHIQAVDPSGRCCNLRMSNSLTQAKVTPNQPIKGRDKKHTISVSNCSMPLVLREGWNHLNIDIERLLNAAFGRHLGRTIQIEIHGGCRLWRCFFVERVCAEAELPPELQVCTHA